MPSQNHIVIGGGRTGSHWIAEVCQFLLDKESVAEDSNLSDAIAADRGWILHTHKFSSLDRLSPEVKKSTTVIVSYRKDRFARAISHAVARHTDEWFFYTDKPVEPFYLDESWLLDEMRGSENYYFDMRQHITGFERVVDIWFEDLVTNREKIEYYIAERLGMDASAVRKKDFWFPNHNQRDYRTLILNYNDLLQKYHDLNIDQPGK